MESGFLNQSDGGEAKKNKEDGTSGEARPPERQGGEPARLALVRI
ncbi:MAG: hypothetical protein DUW69_000357 [Verrucomicrobia bacterium]|jgi:hypothetical protein|nr:MAG: hypothetical protein DUW69_000357 [Verrucomicrobiota bacterium]